MLKYQLIPRQELPEKKHSENADRMTEPQTDTSTDFNGRYSSRTNNRYFYFAGSGACSNHTVSEIELVKLTEIL